ncbi:MAG: extracellular solute-binding protein, partial [Chloroflexota bacterium]|nr:extracellular solute-binding protein [Chloroflexota bacterium]
MLKRPICFALVLALLLLVACQERAGQPMTESASPLGSAVESEVKQSTAQVTEAATATAQQEEAMVRVSKADATATVLPTVTPTEEPVVVDELASVDPRDQTLIFWHPYEDERANAIDELVRMFNESNDYGIMVVAEKVVADGGALDTTIESMRSGAVHLLITDRSQVGAYRAVEGLVDLTPYTESAMWGLSEEAVENFFGTLVASDYAARNDEQLSFPFSRSMEVLYYNADLLKELGYDTPPTNWDAWREVACAAAATGRIGLVLNYELDRFDPGHFASLVHTLGGRIVTEEQDAFTLDVAEAIEAMTFLQAL